MKIDKLIWFAVLFFQSIIVIAALIFIELQPVKTVTSAELAERQKMVQSIQKGEISLTPIAQANLLVQVGKLNEDFSVFSSKITSGMINLVSVLAVCILLEGWLFWNCYKKVDGSAS